MSPGNPDCVYLESSNAVAVVLSLQNLVVDWYQVEGPIDEGEQVTTTLLSPQSKPIFRNSDDKCKQLASYISIVFLILREIAGCDVQVGPRGVRVFSPCS